MLLVDVIEQVFRQLGADELHPVHRSRFNPIIEARWKALGHTIRGDFGQEVSAELHRHCSQSAQWKRLGRDENPNAIDRFMMHGEGYWSTTPDVPLEDL
jgi:hypothetical protein